jgi:hypothetical protein
VVAVTVEYRGPTSRGMRTFLTCDLATQRCRGGRPLREGSTLSVVAFRSS